MVTKEIETDRAGGDSLSEKEDPQFLLLVK